MAQKSDLNEENTLMSFNDLTVKFNLEGAGHFWQYLQIRDCLKDKIKLLRRKIL